MAHLSPRTKYQVNQINIFKKASGRSKKMVTAELLKKLQPPTPAKKMIPLTGSGKAIKNVCPAPTAPGPIKRARVEDLVDDNSGTPEVRRPVAQKNGVAVAAAAEVVPIPTENNIAASDSTHGTSPKGNSLQSSPVTLASAVEQPSVTVDEERPLPAPVVPNGCHPAAAEMALGTQMCAHDDKIVKAYLMDDDSETRVEGPSSPPPPTVDVQHGASPQAIGFENLLKRVENPEPVYQPNAGSPSSSPVAEVDDDSDTLPPRPSVQSLQRRSGSPQQLPAPEYFHGLYNLGNTCYMNTIIQILYNLDCFGADMPRAASLPLRSDGIFIALRQVFQNMTQGSPNQIINPQCLQQACEKYMTEFRGSIQQDAQEYLLNVLDKIDEEVASGQRLLWEQSKVHPLGRERICPTTRNFSCRVRNTLSCEGCGNVVNLDQSSRHFSLPLPPERRYTLADLPDLEALLNLYFQVETFTRKCEKCGAETMRSETKILQLPRVLILHINRFEIDRHMLCSKVFVPVKFAQTLDLGNWCMDKVRGPANARRCVDYSRDDENGHLPALEDCRENCHSNGHTPAVPQEVRNSPSKMYHGKESGFDVAVSTSYSLHCVVSHVGRQASSGHYTVDIHDLDSSKYVRCDDCNVREVSLEEVFCEEKYTDAYVLLYVLQSTED